MRFSSRLRANKFFSFLALASILLGLTMTGALPGSVAHATSATPAANTPMHINCADGDFTCTEVLDTQSVFGPDHYVGHDEPSVLFYSDQPGAGNRMRWEMTLPNDPTPTDPLSNGKSFNFQLHPAFWFGMAMCDTQSFPEQISTCTPDSDQNIVDPAVSSQHPGTAFTEMQFYPPGWARKPFGASCDATQWCAALTIDSLSQNSVTGQTNNSVCLATAGIEPVNFAFITKDGVPQAPANPVDSTLATFTPNPQTDLFMNSGDRLVVTMHDTAHGLRVDIKDMTTHQSGFMVASATNSFGQVKFDPNGTTCQNIPSDYHPMYSTSSELTRVTWAAHSYNIAFSDEIGHFDYCTGTVAVTPRGPCPTGDSEGAQNNLSPADGDDTSCHTAAESLLVQVTGCRGTNAGFDGVAYQPVWPDGNTALHPTSVRFSSPLTGEDYNINYTRAALEADLPRIEATCNRTTGVGCTLIPTTDENQPAAFYPFFSIQSNGGHGDDNNGCTWLLGNDIPGSNDLGRNSQYGPLQPLAYTGLGGAPIMRINDFRQIFSQNPCRANTD